jgi:large subunit ribosomal protein L46
MNTWLVAHHPIGYYNYGIREGGPDEPEKQDEKGEKTFFLKARIMAGKANLSRNKLGLADFKWLAKEEVQEAVQPQYWHAVMNLLVAR